MNLGGLGQKARARLSWTDGPTGKVIGVDMTPEMVSRARKKFSARLLLLITGPALAQNHLPDVDGSLL
jgi:ubiquinone/menaquinone biosynthesis C-methylase UbiE